MSGRFVQHGLEKIKPQMRIVNLCQICGLQSSLPLKIPGDQPVKYILNDEKIKGKETPIKKLYSHLIDI